LRDVQPVTQLPGDLIAAETLEEASPDVVVNFRSEDPGTIDTE
jgi:hypothetical protein